MEQPQVCHPAKGTNTLSWAGPFRPHTKPNMKKMSLLELELIHHLSKGRACPQGLCHRSVRPQGKKSRLVKFLKELAKLKLIKDNAWSNVKNIELHLQEKNLHKFQQEASRQLPIRSLKSSKLTQLMVKTEQVKECPEACNQGLSSSNQGLAVCEKPTTSISKP